MLNHIDAMATIAVKDMKAAREFYERALGLTVVQDTMGAITYGSGQSRLILYESQFETIVRSLGAKGVKFEHYDLPDVKRQGDIHLAGNLRMAWLRDPAGNILALVSG